MIERAQPNDLEQKLAQVKDLQANADAAAGHVRNIFFFFLTFGLYLAVTVGATTHEQLLRESPVGLPILNVEIPLFGFYWIAPALFVLLHFNLMLQFHLLSQKLRRLQAAIRELPLSQRKLQLTGLDSFAFSHMLIGEHHSWLFRTLFRFIIWITVIILPIALLLGVQVRFLPYHDADTTTAHRFLILLDLLLLVVIWPQVVLGAGGQADQRTLWRAAGTLRDVAVSLVAILVGLASLFVFTFPAAHGQRMADDGICAPPELIGDPMEAVLLDPDCGLAPTFLASWWSESPMPRVEDCGVGFQEERPEPVIFGPTLWLLQELPFVTRNLEVTETNLVSAWPSDEQLAKFGEGKAWQNFGQPIALRGRDLRYGRFRASTMVHADLRGADLQGTDLLVADLQGAALHAANFQGANLGDANLQGAVLHKAELQGACLTSVNLQGAGLVGANLQDANLHVANLQGALLPTADLRGANLRAANLQGADLRANLQDADLGNADLQGADLEGANLEGTVLLGANLQGADLRRTRLWRARLNQLTRFRLTDLRAADLEGSVWMGEDIRRALADRRDVLFSTVPPQDLMNFDSALAGFLGDLACARDAPSALTMGIARRAHLEASVREDGRLYPGWLPGASSATPARRRKNGTYG